jgi:hypothetical protein
MDPFVRRLVERLLDPARPLSRNRHFHTFGTPEGKRALRTSRRLQALHRELLACREEGAAASVVRVELEEGAYKLELRLDRLRGRRTSLLGPDEFALLLDLPGVREVLEGAASRTLQRSTAGGGA